jgi:hypothetical protein
MAEAATIRTLTVTKGHGVGVAVQIWEADFPEGPDPRTATRRELGPPHAAGSWPHLYALGAQYGVPRSHWDLDAAAADFLGPEPGTKAAN